MIATIAARFILSPWIRSRSQKCLGYRPVLLWMARRLIWLLQAPFRRRFGFRQRRARIEGRPILVHRCLPVLLQIKYSSQVNMGPGHYLGFSGYLKSPLEIITRALHVPVHGGDLRKNEQRSAGIFIFFV